MKISQLMIIGMFGLFLIFAIYGLVTFDLSIQEMKKFLGTRNEGFSFNMMQGLDQSIENRLSDFQSLTKLSVVQETLKESNEEFEKLENINEFLQKREKEIELIEISEIPFLKEVLDEDLSEELSDTIRLYREEYGHDVVEEIFVTNSYGANVALGSGTSDYRQDDEQWWQIAKNNGLFVDKLKFNEGYESYTMDLGFKISDDDGNFLGILRVLLTLDDMLHGFINEADLINNPSRNVVLLDSEGRVIYSKGINDFANSDSLSYFDTIINSKDVGFFELDSDIEGVRLVSYAKSTGYKTFEGFDWTIIIEQNNSSIVDEFFELRNSILLVSSIGMIASVAIGVVISFFITRPLKGLANLAYSISKGNFEVHAKKSMINEVEVISHSFNKMSDSLKRLIETEKQLAEANVKIKNERLTAIGEVAASMAHNMKNPLATIRTSADIVKRYSKEGSKDLDEVLKRMDNAMGKMSHLIEDVLNFVRTTPLEIKDISVKTLLESSLESIEIPKKITIKIPETLIQIKCDSKKMEIVFINLILNAIQAIEKNEGKITIRVREEGDFVFIEFEDTGKGIPENLISKIFDPLVTTKEKGTGLGLSSSKNIVQQHGGTISAKNNPTTFTIKLPQDATNV